MKTKLIATVLAVSAPLGAQAIDLTNSSDTELCVALAMTMAGVEQVPVDSGGYVIQGDIAAALRERGQECAPGDLYMEVARSRLPAFHQAQQQQQLLQQQQDQLARIQAEQIRQQRAQALFQAGQMFLNMAQPRPVAPMLSPPVRTNCSTWGNRTNCTTWP